jgi:hypothetical protein
MKSAKFVDRRIVFKDDISVVSELFPPAVCHLSVELCAADNVL